MAEIIPIPKEDLARLEARVRDLAREQSNLPLVNHRRSRLSAVPGPDDTVEAIVQQISGSP
jgi:hypothetical protein